MTGQTTLAAAPRARRALGGAAVALVALSFATAPMPVRAASVLSDGSASPTTGTTATVFTFSVHYTSSDPPRPAQAVRAAVGNATVPLTKVSGTALDGTWQGTSTLPAGTWQVTFHAESAGEPPQPLLGPIVTVTAPPPTPQPTPPPPPPTAAPTPVPTQPPVPLRSPAPSQPGPPPTPPATDADDPTAASSPSLTAGASGSAQETANDDPAETPGSFAPATDDADTSPGDRLASLLIVGGAMSLGGAAVLARQWHVTRRGRSP